MLLYRLHTLVVLCWLLPLTCSGCFLCNKGPNISSHLGSRVRSSAGFLLEGQYWEGRECYEAVHLHSSTQQSLSLRHRVQLSQHLLQHLLPFPPVVSAHPPAICMCLCLPSFMCIQGLIDELTAFAEIPRFYSGNKIQPHLLGTPRWLSGEESAYQAGDVSSIPGLARLPRERNGSLLQYSYLGNPIDKGTWWAAVHRVVKESNMTQRQNNYLCKQLS